MKQSEIDAAWEMGVEAVLKGFVVLGIVAYYVGTPFLALVAILKWESWLMGIALFIIWLVGVAFAIGMALVEEA